MRTVAIVSALVLALGGLASAGQPVTGNGAPSGPHYNLNIHGVANGQGFDPTNYNGHNIFAPLNGKCKIDLTEGTTYKVLDPDCITDPAAQFELPPPCGNSTCSEFAYSVWARALTPKGSSNMYTCYTDSTGATYCNTNIVVLKKTKAGQFSNVSKQLLEVCDAATGTYQPLFGNSNYDYFWEYDNYGLRLAQLRFYPISTPSSVTSSCHYSTK